MDEEASWMPKAETAGSMGKPPRLPPTAVGLLTPPPPPGRDPRTSRYSLRSRTRLIAVAMLGVLFVVAGPVVALVIPSAVGAIVGGGSVLVGGSVWWRLARGNARSMLALGSARRHRGPDADRRAA